MKITEIFAQAPAVPGVRIPYVIAKVCLSPDDGMEKAGELALQAADAGADAIEIENPESAFSQACSSARSEYLKDDDRRPLRMDNPVLKKEFETLKTFCDKTGIAFLAMPSDVESALFLNDLLEVIPVSSSDITNKPFINFLCGFNKPIILSTGCSRLYEIAEAVEWIENNGNSMALLHCPPQYPSNIENLSLGVIPALARAFPGHVIGYSDHGSKDTQVLETAVILGAKIIAMRFTHDKNAAYNNDAHPFNASDVKKFYEHIRKTLEYIGPFRVNAPEISEVAQRNVRRSLIAARLIPAGARLTGADLSWNRPGHGIAPRHMDEVIGLTARTDIAAGSWIQWTDLEK